MSEAIVFTSGKGGVGKTTLLANLGIALASNGHSTVMIDADIGLRNLDIVLGIESKIKFNLLDVAFELCTLDQALVYDKRSKTRLAVIAASQSHLKEDLGKEPFKNIVKQLKTAFDFVLIDCPAGIEYGFRNAIRLADRAIVIVNPEVSSIRDADRVIGILEVEKIKKIQLIINRYQHDLTVKGDMIATKEIVDLLGVRLLGIIPEDVSVLISSNEGRPLAYQKNHHMHAYFCNIAQAITGEKKLPEQDFAKNKSESLWKKVKRSFTMNR
jgi:septum site-determining protein MinD